MTLQTLLEGGATLGAAGAAAAALTLRDGRVRSRAALAALVLAGAALAPLVDARVSEQLSRRPAAIAGATLGGLVLVAALALLLRRRPCALAPLAVAALPFRVPLTLGGQTANLLVPLYVVIAAGAVAWVLRPPVDRPAAPSWVRRLDRALALALVLYAVQALYSTDLEQAVKNACFFYVPFAVLYALLRDVAWTPRLLHRCLYVLVALAVLFAAVGFFEFASGRLLIPNAKVLAANEIKPYFRVNSLFFDPNIYGRFLALTMIALAAGLLWARRARDTWAIAVLLAVLWAGLVLSLSQSSFAALLVGLAVLAALRWRLAPVLAVVALGAGTGAAVVLAAPGAIGLHDVSLRSLDRATSGRADLISGGVAMFRARPVWGFGSGAFQERYRARQHVRSKRVAAISHTIPVTIAAEQGAVGLLAYVLVLVAAAAVLLGGLRAAARVRPPPTLALGRIVAAAAFAALVAHTLVYASFLEDPLTWVLLGLGGALRASGSLSPRA